MLYHQLHCYLIKLRSSLRRSSHHTIHLPPLQNLLQLPLLLNRKTSREFHIIRNDEVTPLIRLLAKRHAQVRELFFLAWLRGPSFVEDD